MRSDLQFFKRGSSFRRLPLYDFWGTCFNQTVTLECSQCDNREWLNWLSLHISALLVGPISTWKKTVCCCIVTPKNIPNSVSMMVRMIVSSDFEVFKVSINVGASALHSQVVLGMCDKQATCHPSVTCAAQFAWHEPYPLRVWGSCTLSGVIFTEIQVVKVRRFKWKKKHVWRISTARRTSAMGQHQQWDLRCSTYFNC